MIPSEREEECIDKDNMLQNHTDISQDAKGNSGYARLEIVYDAFPIQKIVGHDKKVPESKRESEEKQSRGMIRYIPVQGFIPPLPSRESSLALGIGISVYRAHIKPSVRYIPGR